MPGLHPHISFLSSVIGYFYVLFAFLPGTAPVGFELLEFVVTCYNHSEQKCVSVVPLIGSFKSLRPMSWAGV